MRVRDLFIYISCCIFTSAGKPIYIVLSNQVNVNGREFKTTSTSMRESKRLAAIGMLEELGYRSRLPERHNRVSCMDTV